MSSHGEPTQVIAPAGSNLARTCYARTCRDSSLPMPHRQASFAPSGLRRGQSTSSTMTGLLPSATRHPQSHLALLRVTPQAPRSGGDVRRAQSQRRNCSSSFPKRSADNFPQGNSDIVAVHPTHSASFTNSPLSARYGRRLLPPRQPFSRLCAPLTGQPWRVVRHSSNPLVQI